MTKQMQVVRILFRHWSFEHSSLIRHSNFVIRHLLLSMIVLGGCHSPTKPAATQPAIAGLCPATRDAVVQADVVPPLGWSAEPLKSTDKHKHQVWLSPSKNTAYGVIYFTLPWPVGPDLALWGFLQQMKSSEGDATLISKRWDDNLGGFRFVADGGIYRVRTNLIVDGFHGWAIYAGTLRGKPVQEAELKMAEQARERTRVGAN
jgi:hypothetical protein